MKKITGLAITLLILGSFSIGGSLGVNVYIKSEVASQVDFALSEIEARAIPLIEAMIPEMAIPVALRGIRDFGIPMVQTMIQQEGVAEVLYQLRETSLPYSEKLVNASFLTRVLDGAYAQGQSQFGDLGGDSAMNMFFDYEEINLGLLGMGRFNEEMVAAGLPSILGVSQWCNQDLLFGTYMLIILVPWPDPNDYLVWGRNATVPGFMENTSFGFGVDEYLTKYEESIGNTTLQRRLCDGYGLPARDYWKFSNLTAYYYDYWIPIAIPLLVAELQNPGSEVSTRMPQYVGMDTDDIAYAEFLAEWANCSTYYPNGMDFHEVVDDIPDETYGFELLRPGRTNINLIQAYALWNETNPCSLTNMSGMKLWYQANSSPEIRDNLTAEFGLTPAQACYIIDWLWGGNGSFSQYLVPILIESEAGYNMTIPELAVALFYSQWANGTILGKQIYKGGLDFHDVYDTLPERTQGFEVGRNTPSNITLQSAVALFNESIPMALTNDDGIKYWINASRDGTWRAELMATFNLSESQLDAILDWLFEESFKDDLVPVLMTLPAPQGVGMTLHEFAGDVFREQWANGTAYGRVLYPYGFPLPLRAGPVYGLEAGYQDRQTGVVNTAISLASADLLWDVNNTSSIVNDAGNNKWFAAVEDPTVQVAIDLQDANLLTNEQMQMLLEWLPKFRDNVMPFLAQEQMNLPMDSTSLGLTILVGGILIGSLLVATSVIIFARQTKKAKKKGGKKTGGTRANLLLPAPQVSQEQPPKTAIPGAGSTTVTTPQPGPPGSPPGAGKPVERDQGTGQQAPGQ